MSTPPLVSDWVRSRTRSPTAVNTPAASSTDQRTATATNSVIPSATDSRKAVFMTDHGSIRISRRRALRTRLVRRTGEVGRWTGRGGGVCAVACGVSGRASRLTWVSSGRLGGAFGVGGGACGAAGGDGATTGAERTGGPLTLADSYDGGGLERCCSPGTGRAGCGRSAGRGGATTACGGCVAPRAP